MTSYIKFIQIFCILYISRADAVQPDSVRHFEGGLQSSFDTLVGMSMQCHNIPSASVAVITLDDESTMPKAYSRGFGTKSVQQGRGVTAGTTVDENTVFCIGDITQTFTATLIAILQDAGLLNSWETPITQLLTENSFTSKIFNDDHMNDIVSLKDLLSMRVPFVDNLGLLVAGFPAATRAEFIDDLKLFTPTNFSVANLRASYSNRKVLQTLVAYVAEQIHPEKQRWEAQIQAALFKPLNMEDATFATLDSQSYEEFAQPVVYEDGRTKEIYPDLSLLKNDWLNAPADSMCVSSSDMIGWLNFITSGTGATVTERSPISDASYLDPIWKPTNPAFTSSRPATENYPSLTIDSFGLGWELGTFASYPLYRRSAEYFGYQSAVWVLPNQRMAAYVSLAGSAAGPEVANAIAEQLLTLLLPLDPPKQSLACSITPPDLQTCPQTITCNNPDQSESESIIGIYSHPGLGYIKVKVDGNGILVNFGINGSANLCKSNTPGTYWLKLQGDLKVFYESCFGVETGLIPNVIQFSAMKFGAYSQIKAKFIDGRNPPIFLAKRKAKAIIPVIDFNGSQLYRSRLHIVVFSLTLLLFMLRI